MRAEIFIPGQTPSKKNSKFLALAGKKNEKKVRFLSSEFYQEWEEKVLPDLKKCELVGHTWHYPLRAGFRYVRNSRHKFDYNNLSQGVLDLLVQAGIIEDDDMNHIIPNGEMCYEVDRTGRRVGVLVILEEI